MTTTDPTTGPQIVSGDYDEAVEALVADEAEDPRTRVAELEEALVQWYDAAQTLRRQRDEARAEIARLERAAHEQGADLWIAEDRLRTLIDEVWRHIGQHDCGSYGECLGHICDRAQALAAGITDTDQPASARVDLVIGLRQRGVPQHPDGPEAAALAEIDRLRTALGSTPDTGSTT